MPAVVSDPGADDVAVENPDVDAVALADALDERALTAAPLTEARRERANSATDAERIVSLASTPEERRVR